MRGEQHKNACMETSQLGQFVPKEHSKGGLYLVRTLTGCKGIKMVLMLEEKTRRFINLRGFVPVQV